MVRLTAEQYDFKDHSSSNGRQLKVNVPKNSIGLFFELLKVIIITLAIVIPVRYFLFQPYYVQGASMEPNFYDKQYLIIDEITYRFAEPQRGDVVVIKVPFEKEALIKRVIGLPGETVKIADGRVTVMTKENLAGQVLQESYLDPGITTGVSQQISVGSGQYFVMGDNRSVSYDSRYFGTISRQQIIGRAWLRLWPVSTWEHFTPPVYQTLPSGTDS